MGIRADQYYWFDGVGDVDQGNWGAYWRGIISDGVLGGVRNELKVMANSTGMFVYAANGEAMIYGVRAFFDNEIPLPIDPADANYPRIDLVVSRANFLNEGASYAEIGVIKGTPAASPVAPALTQQAAQVWENPLAEVLVAKGVSTIVAGAVTDRRTWAAASGLREATVTIAVVDWNSNNEVTKTVVGVLAGRASKVWDTVPEGSRAAYASSDVHLLSNGTGTVSWKCAVKPTVPLTITVIWGSGI